MSLCVGREVNPFQPPINLLLDYLLQEFKKEEGRSYSSMNTIRSAISSIARIDDVPAGAHPLVTRFMRAVFQKRPSLPRYQTTWDPDLVLNYIKSLGLNEDLSLIMLTKKLTMLMLLVSGQRSQVVHLLDVRNMVISDSRVSFQIGDPIKTSRPGSHMSQLSFAAYAPDKLLCVHTTILHYLHRTKDIRGPITRLFLTTKPPIKVASRDTLRRWTKEIMGAAGINLSLFSPHSTRAASSSKAALRLPLTTILTTVGWSRDSTFARFYNKPIAASGQFALAVLS